MRKKRKRRSGSHGCDPAAVFQSSLPQSVERMARARYESERGADAPSWEKLTLEQNRKLREFEYERLLRDGRCGMSYITKTLKYENKVSGRQYAEAEIYPVFRDAAARRRAKKAAKTKEAQRKANERRARQKLERLVNINFSDRDLWCTFGWDDDHMPEDQKGAQADVQKFFRKINRIRKKRGFPNAKYIYLIAFDSYTRRHVHIIMSGDCMSRDEVEDCWTACRRKNTRRLDPDKDTGLAGLAGYVAANPHGTKRWVPSKNLDKIPDPTMSRSKFSNRKVSRIAYDQAAAEEEIRKAYPGYKVTDLKVRWNDINAAFYIHAKMVRG